MGPYCIVDADDYNFDRSYVAARQGRLFGIFVGLGTERG